MGVLDAHTAMTVNCVFSTDGEAIASASGDGRVCLWDVGSATGSVLGGHTSLVQQCAFTPDGTTSRTASVDGTARSWDIVTGQETGSVVAHPGISVLLLQREDDLVLAAGEEGVVLCAEDPLGQRSDPARVGTHGAQIWGLAGLPTGVIVTAGLDGVCRVWDVSLCSERLRYAGDSRAVRGCAAAADGSFVASVSDSGRLHLWESGTGEPLLVTDGPGRAARTVAVGPGGDLVTGGADGAVVLRRRAEHWQPLTLGRHEGAQVRYAIWVTPSRVATCGTDGSDTAGPRPRPRTAWSATPDGSRRVARRTAAVGCLLRLTTEGQTIVLDFSALHDSADLRATVMSQLFFRPDVTFDFLYAMQQSLEADRQAPDGDPPSTGRPATAPDAIKHMPRFELSNWYYDEPAVPHMPGVLLLYETPFRLLVQSGRESSGESRQ
ncbi:WD40 repeat domain-containing protein [Streptomyces sp. NPDC058964]|uniref:WD40 repeat domain-containing protein n=1 Tax=Streptomyces sp. NPDC058964 TaxID=3346681 RepID=UPI0036AF52A0